MTVTLVQDSATKPLTELNGPRILHPQQISIAIVGGGFCGTMGLVNILKTLRTYGLPNTEVNLDWFDEKGSFCRGLPYRHNGSEQADNVFLLNQPAQQMSPFRRDPLSFANWLAKKEDCYNEHSFAARGLYGDFLEAVLESELAKASGAGLRVNVKRRQERVSSVGKIEDDFHIRSTSADEIIRADSVLLSLGHVEHDQFSHLNSSPRYVGNPFELNYYRRALHNKSKPCRIVLIGGGSAYIDAIRAIEFVRREQAEAAAPGKTLAQIERRLVKDTYYVISAAPSLPWPYFPSMYTAATMALFRPAFLKPGKIPHNPSYRLLCRMLSNEISEAAQKGFGPGHVYFGIDLNELYDHHAIDQDRHGLQHFFRLIAYMRGAVTTPQSWKMVRNLNAANRRHLVKGRALPEEAYYDNVHDQYMLSVLTRTGRRIQTVGDVIVNCVAHSRDQSRQHVLEKRVDLSCCPHDSFYTAEREGLYLVGPPAQERRVIPQHWGVELFRNEVERAAVNAVVHALERFKRHRATNT